MKTFLCNERKRGLTLVELCIVIAVITIFLIMVMSGAASDKAKARALRISCINNLKQLGAATRIWEGDHGDKYPWNIPGTNGGTMDFISGTNSWRHFQVMSNELGLPKVLVCPADELHLWAATNFHFFSNSNLSYFVGLDVSDTNPQGILFGDRNITNGTPIKNGILTLTTNRPAGWTDEMHHKVGNIVLSDGSLQQVSQNGLRQAFANSNNGTNRLQMPVLTP